MDAIPKITALSNKRSPQVRPALRLLKATRRSVNEVLRAVALVENSRRSANSNTKGRMSRVEVDLLRATVVLTSSGLDATMTRLVGDAGRHLVTTKAAGAHGQYVRYLDQELNKNRVSDPIRRAIISEDPGKELLDNYLREKTKSSFQGSNDLKNRVRGLLGITKTTIDDTKLESLNDFFTMRNEIVHQMDFKNVSGSEARNHRDKESTTVACSNVFSVSAEILIATHKLTR